jgi:hypothetical protein
MTWMFLAAYLSNHPAAAFEFGAVYLPSDRLVQWEDNVGSEVLSVGADGRCFAALPSGEMVEDNGPVCRALFRLYRPNTTQ